MEKNKSKSEEEEKEKGKKTEKKVYPSPNISVKWREGILKTLNPLNNGHDYVGIGIIKSRDCSKSADLYDSVKQFIADKENLGYFSLDPAINLARPCSSSG